MPNRDWRIRIQDILQAISKIERYVAGMSRDEFAADEKTVDAEVRNLEIIGEAARHVPGEIEARYPKVPWAEMRAIRNIVIHEYFGVSLPIIWVTIKQDLPSVVPMLKEILAREG